MNLIFHGSLRTHDKNGKWIQRPPGITGVVTHTAGRIELSKGDQGIPNGFELVALCGATSVEYSINLFEDESMFPACPECKERLP